MLPVRSAGRCREESEATCCQTYAFLTRGDRLHQAVKRMHWMCVYVRAPVGAFKTRICELVASAHFGSSC